ncbi:MAG TPA: VOC family protein [Spongiibacteraceae bacterium]|nr:glyoxalase/bleomycin resistance/dioxygenase family protein [Spongiibacteraceae bacterium]HCS26372.1 VOC family protein [Spongiibacteraceae bacterium]|tara:strand:+ start:74 stop:490 length:417 start_codon:yes stop_codon:yes gene_type:complete
MSAQLTHIALHVGDLGASMAFYREYCGLQVCHQRRDEHKTIVWMAEPGRETEFILVLIPGGPGRPQAENDFSHQGYALASKQAVDDIARRAADSGCLLWPPRQEAYPVGYYCGLRDPDGNAVEFSYGQPLGPGAEDAV